MLKRWLARGVLRIGGWALETTVPPKARYVLLAAPHTSNWDFVWLLALAWSVDVDLHWMGKASLFSGPLGPLMRALGGIPIERGTRSRVVDTTVAVFAHRPEFVVTIPAEGTRGAGAYWRSGFYHIARLARVPIVLGYLDYPRRRGGLGPVLEPSGDVRADMDVIRAFYANKRGRFPGAFTEPRLIEETVNGREGIEGRGEG
ncbi:MAG: lysophospholipid acyltransferase family protein [Pseudomonadales bacterium]